MDWMPMVRVIERLQQHAAAAELFAFTSLSRLHVTTAPSYLECDGHYSVSIVWRFDEARFHLAIGSLSDGWLDDRPPEEICDESHFPMVVDPLIQRVLKARPGNQEGEQAVPPNGP